MTETRHLILSVPADWTTDDKGDFYEEFILEILRPMRFRAERRLRVTGMEVDILAKGEDQPLTILIECKAHRDPISADTITKLMGNVQLRRADQGWLFTTSDLTKDGRGLWEEIQNDGEHAKTLLWYSPSRTIDVLVSQRTIVNPATLLHHIAGADVGDWTLVVTPGKRAWLVELLEEGIPTRYSAFDARDGTPLNSKTSSEVAASSPRYSGLSHLAMTGTRTQSKPTDHSPVAKVIAGDAWDDPRPARPIDFVGRDDVLEDISRFLTDVRNGLSSTRSFAIQAPSGWGKSSLALKLAQRSGSKALPWCSITAVDSRSATTPAFVAEALRIALRDAVAPGARSRRPLARIQSLREPLESVEVQRALGALQDQRRIAVLILDQFEELFAKEALFEVFNAVRDLTLDVDARQVPLILGFAWKTDVSLPQEHPAYHLWHQLSDRRRSFRVREFGKGEIARVVSKAERALGKKLSRALSSRLAEQCQGLPWLLKKLLVHVLQRVSTLESQYMLLERELDVELLFKQDLEQLQDEHIKCLQFVAARAPISVTEVEDKFTRATTNLLVHQHLLVRSGMNYVVYWDIFRDYLVEGKVPAIPWARTFQRMPPIGIKALAALEQGGAVTASGLAAQLHLKEGPTFNVLGDLVALQLVEPDGNGAYRRARHLVDLGPTSIAATVRSQLRRHVVAQAIERRWQRGEVIDYDAWIAFFGEQQPRSRAFSPATLRQYAGNLKSWLVFAGLIELSARGVVRADGDGAQMGVVAASKAVGGLFLGTAAPAKLESLLELLFDASPARARGELQAAGYRNAIADALALGLVDASAGPLLLRTATASAEMLVREGKAAVAKQPAIQLAVECLRTAQGDRRIAASEFNRVIGASWKPASAVRYFGGLIRYAAWAGISEGDA